MVASTYNSGTHTGSVTYETTGTGATAYSGSCGNGGTVQGFVTSGLKLDEYALNLGTDFNFLSGAVNNQINDLSPASTTSSYVDNGTNDAIQYFPPSGNNIQSFKTGANADAVTINEAQTGGYLLSAITFGASPAPPVEFGVNPSGTVNGVAMNGSGVLAKIGSGSVNADQTTLTSPLPVNQGGTGVATLAARGENRL